MAPGARLSERRGLAAAWSGGGVEKGFPLPVGLLEDRLGLKHAGFFPSLTQSASPRASSGLMRTGLRRHLRRGYSISGLALGTPTRYCARYVDGSPPRLATPPLASSGGGLRSRWEAGRKEKIFSLARASSFVVIHEKISHFPVHHCQPEVSVAGGLGGDVTRPG
jgi:hypothetical protein